MGIEMINSDFVLLLICAYIVCVGKQILQSYVFIRSYVSESRLIKKTKAAWLFFWYSVNVVFATVNKGEFAIFVSKQFASFSIYI